MFDRVARTRGSTVRHGACTAGVVVVQGSSRRPDFTSRCRPSYCWSGLAGKLDMGLGMVWLGRLTPVAIRGRYQIRFNAYSAQAGHARSGGFGSCGHLEEIAR
jgi:hypothetical protein